MANVFLRPNARWMHEAKQLLRNAMQPELPYDRMPAPAVTDITLHAIMRKNRDDAWLAGRYPRPWGQPGVHRSENIAGL
jgi:hypothetical protein